MNHSGEIYSALGITTNDTSGEEQMTLEKSSEHASGNGMPLLSKTICKS